MREALVIAGFEVLFPDELFELSIESGRATLIWAVEGGAHGQSVYRALRLPGQVRWGCRTCGAPVQIDSANSMS
jgi:hypothetical protein